MSNAVFPSLPGITMNVYRRPMWSTKTLVSASGKEARTSLYSYPRYKYTLEYEFLRSDSNAELQTLVAFYNSRQGSFDSFLYTDPDDNSVTAQQFAIGNGSTSVYQLTRSFGGYLEPVFDFNGAPQVYKNADWQGNQLQYTSPRQNLCKYSEQFDNAAWTKTGVTVSANTTVSPDGATTADTISGFAAGSQSIACALTGENPASHTYAFSVWLKGTGTINLRMSNNVGQTFDFQVTLSSTWTRYSFVRTFNASVGNLFASIISKAGDTATSVIAFGAQLENSDAPSTYIATTSTQTTVSADYTLGSNGVVTFGVAPASGAILTWTGSYYRRVRFMEDTADFQQFMYKLWQLKKIEFISLKP